MSDPTAVPIHVRTKDADAIDAVGLALPSAIRLFAVGEHDEAVSEPVATALRETTRAEGHDASADPGEMSDRAARGLPDGPPVRWSVHADERALLSALSRVVRARVLDVEPTLLTFECAHARTTPACWSFRRRAGQLDPACPLVGLPYVDLAPLVGDRTDAGSARSLDRAYEAIAFGDRNRGAARNRHDELRERDDDADAGLVLPTADTPSHLDAIASDADGVEATLARTLAALIRIDAVAAAVLDDAIALDCTTASRPERIRSMPDAS